MADTVELLVGEKQPGESDKAVVACNDWLRAGAGRSIPKLLEQYQQSSTFINSFKPPSTSGKTLKTWSSRFGWPARASEYDATWEARKNAERQAVMDYGLALDYERVRKLIHLAEFLEAQIYEQISEQVPASETLDDADTATQRRNPNVWLKDIKGIGSKEDFERVEIERFNAALIEQYRKVLDDLAKEVGGRIHRHEHAGPEGGGIPVKLDGMKDILQMMGLLDKHGRTQADSNDTE